MSDEHGPISDEEWRAVGGPPVTGYGAKRARLNGSSPPIDCQDTIEGQSKRVATYGNDGSLWTTEGVPGLIRLADVEPERVGWLWHGRVPLAKITIMDGDPGLGKSLVTTDIAARVSIGAPMPDGTRGDLDGPAGVVMLSAEDGLSDTIRPRLDAAGADVTRIAALTFVTDAGTERLPTLADLNSIETAIAAVNAKLLITDPFMAFLPGKLNAHSDQEVRQALTPLSKLAERTGVAVLLVRHLNKSGAASPLYRGGGSIGIIGAARSALLVAVDPDDESGARRIIAMTKSNLAAPMPALAYRIEVSPNGVPYVKWEGATTHTAAALLVAPDAGEGRDALTEAMEFLQELLANGPLQAEEALKEAKRAAIAERTLNRAKRALGVRARREGFGRDGKWLWRLPEPEPEPEMDTLS